MEKAKGSDSGMSSHIERKHEVKNADPGRTHFNRELIEFADGIKSRSQAITRRIESAGLTRKIGNNQVRAIRILLTASHEDMKYIEKTGKLSEWCADNIA